jgi:ribosomal protein S17E
VKRSAREIIERYHLLLTLDFHTNKKIVDDCADLCEKVPSKQTRNKIAGFVTQLMKKLRNQGYVHGVDLAEHLDTAEVDTTVPSGTADQPERIQEENTSSSSSGSPAHASAASSCGDGSFISTTADWEGIVPAGCS